MIKAQCVGFINTPPLWEAKQFDIQQFEFPRVDLQSFQPKSIPRNIRLGHQIEYVFKQLLEYSDDYNVVLYNLPIRQGKRTLGEIDFILEDTKKSKLIHVELTYKFYIIDPEVSDPIHRLIGPNRRDSFFAKMEKIKHVQFQLLYTEEGTKALDAKRIDHLNIEHQSCFKAQLFKPFGSKHINIGTLNNDCLAGEWIRFDDLNTSEFVNAQFYIPTKSEWVVKPNDQVSWKSHFDIMIDVNLFLLKEICPMVWLKTDQSEIQKIFVVWW